MVILHIAAIENNPFNGVCVAVPKHVISQMACANVAFINTNNVEIDELKAYPGIQKVFVNPFDIKKLPKPFNKPDLVIFHECYRLDYLRIAKNLKKHKVRYIVMPHGELRVEAQKKKHVKKVIANLLLFNDFISQGMALQCLSNDELKATHFGKKKFIGTNGIDIPIKQKLHFNESSVVFVYIGRYEWRVKGLDLLFEAIKKNADYLKQKHCVFLFYGPDVFGRLEQVRQLVKKNQIEDLVSLNHEVSGNEKEKVLLNADIFIQTSRHEGMPMGILEAMSYGIPCLVTEGTTLKEYIDEVNAGWTTSNTVDEISCVLLKASEERSEWKIKGNNGRNSVKEDYVWGNVANCIVKKYKALLES